LRQQREFGSQPVIPNNPDRMRKIIERAFARLEGSRCIATRYDKLARTFRSAVALVSSVTYWL